MGYSETPCAGGLDGVLLAAVCSTGVENFVEHERDATVGKKQWKTLLSPTDLCHLMCFRGTVLS